MLKKLNMQKGDTIIELMLAFAIFSLAAITTIAILNKGLAISQRTYEKSLVRQQLDSQAEMLRYISDTNDPAWGQIKTIAGSSSSAGPLSMTGPCHDTTQIVAAKGFFITSPKIEGGAQTNFGIKSVSSENYSDPVLYAQVDNQEQKTAGVWIQVLRAEGSAGAGSVAAYDFYIHGCWDSAGQEAPMTVGTIVRLYDQRQ